MSMGSASRCKQAPGVIVAAVNFSRYEGKAAIEPRRKPSATG
jgi:hypothetical protein